ncbi:MAG: hypothetical protein ACKOS8_14935, partial [Gemmataceae bacterium]
AKYFSRIMPLTRPKKTQETTTIGCRPQPIFSFAPNSGREKDSIGALFGVIRRNYLIHKDLRH